MPTREQLIQQYGGWDNLPDYLKRGFEQQDQAEQRRQQEQRDHEARLEAERERIKSLRRPPRNVRLVKEGRVYVVYFEPPVSASSSHSRNSVSVWRSEP